MKRTAKSNAKSTKLSKERETQKCQGKFQTISSMFQRAGARLSSSKSVKGETQEEPNSSIDKDEDVVIVEVEETHSSYFKPKKPHSFSSGTEKSLQKSVKRPNVNEDFKPRKRSKLSLSKEDSVSKQESRPTVDNVVEGKDHEASDTLSCVEHVNVTHVPNVLIEQSKSDSKRDNIDKNEDLSNFTNQTKVLDAQNCDDNKESVPIFESTNKTDIKTDLSCNKPLTVINAEKNLPDTAVKLMGNHEDTEASYSSEKEEFTEPYYFNNFETILAAVLQDESNSQLFDGHDRAVIDKYHALSDAAKKIYIRLFSRRLQWIPLEKMNYPEIDKDLRPHLDELVTCSFAYNESNLKDLKTVLEALSAPDVKALAKVYHVPATITQKGQQVAELMKQTQRPNISHMFGSAGGQGGLAQSMLARAKKFLTGVYKLCELPRALFMRVMMLFSVVDTSLDEDSGIGGQGQLFHMLMVNMGKVVYPEFQIIKTHSIFGTRADVMRFSEALQLEFDFLHATEKGKWDEAYNVFLAVQEKQRAFEADQEVVSWNKNLPDYLRAFTATSVIYRLLSQGIEVLQRRKDFTAAVNLIESLLGQKSFCCSYRGYWYERLALNQDAHLKKPQQSLEAVLNGLADPFVRVGHRLALYLRGKSICERPRLKLSHRLKECHHHPLKDLPKVYLEGRVLDGVTGSGPRFLTQNSYRREEDGERSGDMAVCGVEEFVIDHYRTNGFPSGMHAEGSVVSSLFALFCWDILFLPKPDAFHSPYQTMPLDLYTDDFYARRKSEIDERMKILSNSSIQDLQAMAEESWSTHEGVACVGMNWERMRSANCIKELVACMGSSVMTGILSRYAHNPRHTRSGFPDLTLWNPATGAFKICEVKGPGDRLSNKQILWLDYLLDLRVDAEVCHVKAVAAKKLMPSS